MIFTPKLLGKGCKHISENYEVREGVREQHTMREITHILQILLPIFENTNKVIFLDHKNIFLVM